VTAVSKVATATSGVAGYTVTVGFSATEQFYVGTTVTAAITTSERSDVVQVSSRAISTTQDGSTVTVATDGTTTGATKAVTVTTGSTSNGMTEILTGVTAGQKVIITVPSGMGGGAPPAMTGQSGAGQPTQNVSGS